MNQSDLKIGYYYLLDTGEFLQFGYFTVAGAAIFHPPNEPDMQSSCVVRPEHVLWQATEAEAREVRGEKR